MHRYSSLPLDQSEEWSENPFLWLAQSCRCAIFKVS